MHTQAPQLEQSQITEVGWNEVYQLLYCVTDNYTNTLSHTHLALLVAIGQKLQAVCGDSQELGVALIQQGNHPLQAVS